MLDVETEINICNLFYHIGIIWNDELKYWTIVQFFIFIFINYKSNCPIFLMKNLTKQIKNQLTEKHH